MKPTLIEFSNETGYPFQVWERREDSSGRYNSYDVEFCRTWNALYATMSRCGGSSTHLEGRGNKYWLADGEPLPVRYSSAGEMEPAPIKNRLAELPEQYRGDMWNWLEEDRCYYCFECDDWLPMNDGACEHLWDCDECDSVNWPGEECGHERVNE